VVAFHFADIFFAMPSTFINKQYANMHFVYSFFNANVKVPAMPVTISRSQLHIETHFRTHRILEETYSFP
jgi:hypothetical protein